MAINVLLAKLIPPNIEASMFAILTGLQNFCSLFLARQLGNFFNIFVGVTDDDLSDLWILYAITLGLSFMPILFLWLVPKRKEVFLVQQVHDFLETYPPKKQVKPKERSTIDDDEDEEEDQGSGNEDIASDNSEERRELIDAIMKLDPNVAK